MSDLAWLIARPIAHRGLHDMNQSCWENTLTAFERAAAHDYAIECDVHLSTDGVPVVFHDAALDRLTGLQGHIWEKTAAELAALPIGGTADRIPTLQEVLDLVDGRVPVVIELKAAPHYDEGLLERVASQVSRYPGNVALMSFEHQFVRQFRTIVPGIPAGLTAEGTSQEEIEAHFSMLAHEIAFVSFSVGDLPNPFAAFVRNRLSMPVITWTVRDQESVTKTFQHADQMTFEGFLP